jgi:DNA polymerase-3 subunit alpha
VELFEMIKKFAGYGFNKCVVGSTVIVDAQTGERTTVGDLFDRGRPFAVHALDERGKLRPRLVTDVVLNGRKRVFRVRTMLGNEFVATANHPLRRLNGWTTIDELRVGERIAAPRQMSIAGVTSWPRDEVIALAHLLAEGNTCHPTCLYFYNDSPELIDDFVAAIQQFPETVARIDRRADGRRMEVCVSTGRDARFQRRQVPWNKSVAESGTDNATATAIASAVRSGAYHWAAGLDILNRKATEKFVPAAVFQLTDHDVALFLGRLWSGDGYVARKQQMPYYATSSLQLARDVRFLLLRLGIVSRLTRKIFKYRYQGRVSERPGYTVHVVGADSLQAFLKLVTPHIIGRATEIAQLHEYRATLRSGLTSKDTIPAAVRAWVNEERVRHGLKWRDLEVQSGVCIRELCTSKNPLKRGFRRATIHKLADFFDSARLRDIAQSDIYWDTVVSIEPLGLEDTYDLTVEKDHNFVADGLVVHNSHSTAYALIAYMTAYLKTHFACEFMAALLSGDITGRNFKKKDSLVEHLEDCRRMGLEVLPPDVNSSDVDFGVRVEVGDSVALLAASSGTDPLPSTEAASRSITFGLSAIKGCGGQAAAALVVERKKNGVYRDLFDFCERVDPALCNRATIESLIKAGAFDFAGARRAQLMAVLDRAMQTGAALLADRKSGQKGLFDDADEGPTVRVQSLPDLPEWDEKEKLACEKEVLGFYLTSHPLAEHAETLASYCSHNTAAVATLPGRSEVVMGGMIGAIKHSQTKNPRAGETNTRYAMFDLEDMEGMIRCILWPSDFVNYGHLVADGAIVALRGSIDRRPGSDEANLIVNEIFPLSELAQRFTRGVRVRLDEQQHGERAMDSLHEILRGYPGTCEVELALVLADGAKLLLKCNSPKIQLSVELRTRLDDLLGPGNVKLIAAPPSTREPGTRGNGNGIQHRASNGVQRRMASV